ncbi:MAG: hypothetical protein K0R99_4733 [Microbacterium sp.]|nr:hypothetical protein [Microbacterium sp.]
MWAMTAYSSTITRALTVVPMPASSGRTLTVLISSAAVSASASRRAASASVVDEKA